MSSVPQSDKENPIGDYLLNEEIGSGGFAKVVQGIHIPTGEKVAVKIMDKAQIFSEPLNLTRIQREIAILKIVRHRNIIKLYELMETPNKIYLVMEYCNGGELFDYIVSKQHLTERQACRFFQEIINSLEYLHSLNIVHRDIKPENLLLDKINSKITLKLIDFGISNCYSPEKLLGTPCGTASYAPPEMHKGEEYYGLLSDVWSAGVVLYAMVFGYLPFCEDDEDTNINNIIEGNYEIPEEASPELADLLVHLLDINPLTRYDLEQIKQHPWFNMVKEYKSVPGVIEGYHRIPIDMKIVEACEQYGYEKDKVIESVEKCKYNRNSSVYYIILSKFKREGYHSISDLFSDVFLKYIRDPKNIIYKGEEELDELLSENDNDDYDRNRKREEKIGKNKITRHQSHPVSENNLSIKEYMSLDLQDEKIEKKKKKHKNKDEKKQKSPTKEKNNENKPKNSEKKESAPPVYTKPKVKVKKIKNEKAHESNNNPDPEQDTKQMTISSNNQINYRNSDNNNIYVKSMNNIRKKSEKKEKDKRSGNKNNRSFSQSKKSKHKKEKKVQSKNNFPEIVKKPEDNALKTEIMRKNLNERMMPVNSFHIISKTKEILNGMNNNEAVNLDFMNISFNKKLSDDIKENILKLKNPKTNISEKEKEKKINNALLSLKMKKQRKKGEYNYNSKHNKNKKNKVPVKGPIFKDNNRKDHTIIHNRNASLAVENRNNKVKNLSTENNNNIKRKDFSLSPKNQRSDSHERKNIINIYVQNKNNINSNNVYNINLITRSNYSLEKSNINKSKHNKNIKVKKIKMSRQNFGSIDQKYGINSNNYLNTTNIYYSNRNRKYGFKSNQNIYLDKGNKVFSNSQMQYQSANRNNSSGNRGRAFSQKNNVKNNKYFKDKYLYNNSFNNKNNKKKIRITFKPIEEGGIDDINLSKKNFDIGKINSKQKIKKVESASNNKRKIISKYHHNKSRSLMDTESLKNHPHNNNYTMTENQKISQIRSSKCASMKEINNKNNIINSSTKPKKQFNISFINLHTNDNKQMLEPKKYKGPLDLSCLLAASSLNILIDKISNVLKRNKVTKIFVNPYKLRCTKNGEAFEIEFLSVNDNIKSSINFNNFVGSGDENDVKFKTITEGINDKNINLYYYTILSKISNSNKNLVKIVSKLINSKFGLNKLKK